MKVLVCGGRSYGDSEAVWKALDALDATLVITGGATGADSHAQSWASRRGKPLCIFPAPWLAMGKAAGPARNGWMLTYCRPDLVLAFPGGSGTRDVVRRAEIAGVEVRRVAGAADAAQKGQHGTSQT